MFLQASRMLSCHFWNSLQSLCTAYQLKGVCDELMLTLSRVLLVSTLIAGGTIHWKQTLCCETLVLPWQCHGNITRITSVNCMDHCKCSKIHQWHTSTDIYTCRMSGRPHQVWISSLFCWYSTIHTEHETKTLAEETAKCLNQINNQSQVNPTNSKCCGYTYINTYDITEGRPASNTLKFATQTPS